jgi:type I restriction enzyme, S subunit
MKGWIKERISENTRIIPGYAFDSNDFIENGIPIIKIANVKIGQVDLEDNSTQYVDAHFLKSLSSKYQVKKGDILVSLTGSHLTQPNSVVGRVGRYRYNKTALVNQRAAKIESIKEKSDRDFVYYLLSTDTLRKEIALLAHGAANQANVSHKDIEKIKVFWPSLPIQRKIAAVLSAYDDLIENNKRRLAILEKMAEELYREWFVRLHFPGHEKIKITKSVPEGWDVKRIGEIIEYYIGGGWGEDNEDINHSVGAFVIRGTDIPNLKAGKFNEPPFRFHKISNYESRKLKVGDIVFEVSGGSKDQLLGRSLLITKGILELCNESLICASFCKLIRPSISPFFINYFLQAYYECGLVDTFQIQSTGISNYQFEAFMKYQTIIIPPKPVLDQFDSHIDQLIKEIDALAAKNRLLINSRDRLLTRLMSGKIDVESLDIQFPISMTEEAMANA